ncbi:putative tricarboxylic transport membrane protein [Palleronia aestuarii]|uniref:Putative tricarboxylic transport membrane protein n=1 Tax=Palleronia aestuarii TaxID=568105 RepID=A0A2W7NAG4_9RHOB|nr:tripartite tricarboxylate transporter TctB family protein [Palleronia aestuarii]PZX17068.1 putative tricarboxylic transport membrane protein [Palleronia aestuarii]
MTMSLADRLTAIVLGALGLSMAVGGYTMDRLEIRQIHPASIPGLVPMILGALLALCAGLLWREAARAREEDAQTFHDGSWLRLAVTAGLCLVYALVLVGWLPFFWSTAIFTAAFSAIFSWQAEASTFVRARSLAVSAILGGAVALGTSALFAEVFLVRLP